MAMEILKIRVNKLLMKVIHMLFIMGHFIASIPVFVPADALLTNAIGSRFRVSTDNVTIASPCGTISCATDGEIEDYLIQVECPPEVCLPVQIQINRGN